MTDHPLPPGFVEPLGVFGTLVSRRAAPRFAAQLRALERQLDSSLRALVSDYLRGGEVIAAIMTYDRDVLENRFYVPSGILTDGRYYWRSDAAEYVAHYGIGLPSAFLSHAESHGWKPPVLRADQVRAIDAYLEKNVAVLRD